MTVQAVSQEKQGRPVQDYRLLLKSLDKAAFDEEGTRFVARSLSAGIFWQAFSDEEILGLASVAQQHGLIDKGLEILEWLTDQRPEYEQGWLARLELLHLLGRQAETATVLARLPLLFPAEKVEEWKRRVMADGGLADPGDRKEAVLDPFVRFRRDQEDIALYMRLFRGREDAFARQWADREQGKQGYVPVPRPMLAEDIREHLQGRKTYGIYLLTGDNMAWTGVIDVDLIQRLRDREEAKKEREAIRREAIYVFRRIRELAAKAGLTCIPEVSGGKGYHYWFPAEEPVEAGTMKTALQALAREIAGDIKCFALEIFPKQDALKGKGYGNLVKLPLGVHRRTGGKSGFIPVPMDKPDQQFAFLRTVNPAPAENFRKLAAGQGKAEVIVHPRQSEWAEKYPELAVLSSRCAPLGQIIAVVRANRELSLREEKVLLGVLAHHPRGRLLLHHLFSRLPEYNRPLLDYKISRIRGAVLGCKRIHSLLEGQVGDLPCVFEQVSGYPHPLLHLPDFREQPVPVSERVVNLQDALLNLKTAIEQIQRFL